MTSCWLADGQPADGIAVEVRCRSSACAERPRRCGMSPPCTMPNIALARLIPEGDACSARPSAATVRMARRSRVRLGRQRQRIRRAASGCRHPAGPGSRSSARATTRSAAPSICDWKVDALLGQFPQFRQRHHLKPAAIGQDRMRPAGEFMQAAKPRHALGAGPQHQVVGVAQDDVGADATHLAPVYMALTVPPVPTGIKAGVRISPRGMSITPRRALPSVARTLKPNGLAAELLCRGSARPARCRAGLQRFQAAA